MTITRELTDAVSAKTSTDIQLGSCVTEIGDGAFSGYSNINEIEFPDSVTTIGASAFESCYNLEYLTISSGITDLGNKAFGYCSNLKKITVEATTPPTLYESGQNSVFTGSSCNIYVPSDSYDDYIDKWSVYKDRIWYEGQSFKVIFRNADTQKTIKCNDSTVLTQSEVNGNYLNSTTATTFGNCITEIGTNALSGRTLGNVAMPSTITTLGEGAFYNAKITSISLSQNLTSIPKNAFNKLNSGYTSVGISISNMPSLTSIGESAFTSSNIESLTITNVGNGCTIGKSAFRSCANLTAITIDNSVTEIGDESFESCGNISGSLSFPNLVSLGASAFSYCNNIESISIPKVKEIKESTFEYCRKITNITANSYTAIGNKAFKNCSGLTSIDIPSTCLSIGDEAFNGCNQLNKITIPSNILSIGASAFSGCSKLSSIMIERSTPPSLGSGAFDDSICLIYVPQESYDLYVGAEGWSAYADRIFEYGDDYKVMIYNEYSPAIVRCNDSTVISESEVTEAMRGKSNGTVLDFGGCVTEIGDGAFSGSSWGRVEEIKFSDKITKIGNDCFRYIDFYLNDKKASFTLPNSLVTIGDNAFNGIKGNVVIPSGVTSIGKGAFEGSYSIKPDYIKFLSVTPPTLGYSVMFRNIDKIYVPCSAYETYNTAWSSYGFNIISYGDYEKDEEVVGEYICEDGNKYKKMMHYISSDEQTWCQAGYVKGDLIEASSEDCSSAYTVDLNSQWSASTSYGNITDTENYDFYESYSNYNVNNGKAMMFINIYGYTSFTFKVRNYSESNYDYVVVNNLDDTSTPSWQPSSSNVYYTNKGKSSATEWYDVTFSNLDGGSHTIAITYGKDSGGNSNDDKGYVAIPKNQ